MGAKIISPCVSKKGYRGSMLVLVINYLTLLTEISVCHTYTTKSFDINSESLSDAFGPEQTGPSSFQMMDWRLLSKRMLININWSLVKIERVKWWHISYRPKRGFHIYSQSWQLPTDANIDNSIEPVCFIILSVAVCANRFRNASPFVSLKLPWYPNYLEYSIAIGH